MNISKWVRALFGDKVRLYSSTGAWRITSKDLGRNLEEDLSISQRGVWDFGTEKGGSPIDLVLEYGPLKKSPIVQPTAADAALWLCKQMGVAPEALGWNEDDGGAKGEQETTARAEASTTARSGRQTTMRMMTSTARPHSPRRPWL